MLRRLLIAVVLLAFVFVIGAALLPGQIKVERSTEIAAPASKVYALVSGFARYNEWSPWFERDPAAKYTYSGPPAGKGAKMSWVSDKDDVGSGSQEITAAEQDRRVDIALDFGDMGQAKAGFLLAPGAAANSTKVTWLFENDVGSNPLMRWMGLMFDRWIGGDYEKGLAKLKALAEKP